MLFNKSKLVLIIVAFSFCISSSVFSNNLGIKDWSWSPPASKPFPIMAYFGPNTAQISDASWSDMDEAGFNLCYSPFWWSEQLNTTAINLGKKYGIGSFIWDPRVNGDNAVNQSDLSLAVNKYSGESSFTGFFLKDEPNVTNYPTLASWRNAYENLDSNHFLYVNLFPDYASTAFLGTNSYSAYVNSFIQTVNPKFLSYDYYCITTSGLRPTYYQNLEFMRSVSLSNNIPFWAFTLSIQHLDYQAPTEGNIRFQLFSSLAYGAKGLQYYTYCNIIGASGLIDSNGNRTATYYIAKKINNEIQNLGALLLSLDSVAVYHTSPAPQGTTLFGGHGGITSCNNVPAVISFFDSPEKGSYFMVVNRDYVNAENVVLTFDSSVKAVYEANRFTTNSPLVPIGMNNQQITITLSPGNGRLFTTNSPNETPIVIPPFTDNENNCGLLHCNIATTCLWHNGTSDAYQTPDDNSSGRPSVTSYLNASNNWGNLEFANRDDRTLPTFYSNSPYGGNYLTFDGVMDSICVTNGWPGGDSLDLNLSFRYASLPSGAALSCLFYTHPVKVYLQSDATLMYLVYDTAESAHYVYSSKTLNPNVWYSLICAVSNNNLSVTVGNTNEGYTTDIGTATGLLQPAWNLVYIGDEFINHHPYYGDIDEIRWGVIVPEPTIILIGLLLGLIFLRRN